MTNQQQSPISISQNQFGDVYIDVVNQGHFTNRSARQIYKDIVEKNLNQENTLYVVIGSDSGLFPKHIENFEKTPTGTNYLFIELDSLYDLMLGQLNGMIMNKCIVANIHDWEDWFNQEGFEKYIYDEKVLIVNSLAAKQGHIQDYIKLKEKVTSRLGSIQWERLSTTNQEKFLEQQLLNTVDNIYPVKMLEGISKGDALVLGAGPSLEKFIPWIQENQDKVYIIAASRLYQQLSYNNIKPDMIVSSDPFDINYHQSKAFLADDSIVFIHTNHVNYRLPAQWGGLSFYRDKLFPWESKNNHDNFENEGPTVTHCAVSTAIEMGFDDIYLAGVDLCYDKTGATHTDSLNQITQQKDTNHPLVTTYKGDIAVTDYNLQMGVKDLSEIALRHNGRIFNLNESAAQVQGIALSAPPSGLQKKGVLPDIPIVTEKQRLDHINIVKNELTNTRLAYSEINKISKEAIGLNNKIFQAKDEKIKVKNYHKLDKLEQKLNTKFKNYIELAKLITARDFLRLLNKQGKNQTNAEEHKWLHNFYSAYLKGSEIILSAVEKAIVEVNQRTLEYSPKPNFTKIFNYWDKSKITGRSCLWLHTKEENHKSLQLNQIQDMCDSFNKFCNEDISFKRRIGQLRENFSLIIYDLIIKQDKEKLIKLKNDIYLRYPDNQFKAMKLYIEAGVELVNDNKSRALNLFENIPNFIDFNSHESQIYFDKSFFYCLFINLSKIDFLSTIQNQLLLQKKIEVEQKNTELKKQQRKIIDEQILKLRSKMCPPFVLLVTNLYNLKDLSKLKTISRSISELFSEKNILVFSVMINITEGLINQIQNNIEKTNSIYTNLIEKLTYDINDEFTYGTNPLLELALLKKLYLADKDERRKIYKVILIINDKYKINFENTLQGFSHYSQNHFHLKSLSETHEKLQNEQLKLIEIIINNDSNDLANIFQCLMENLIKKMKNLEIIQSHFILTNSN